MLSDLVDILHVVKEELFLQPLLPPPGCRIHKTVVLTLVKSPTVAILTRVRTTRGWIIDVIHRRLGHLPLHFHTSQLRGWGRRVGNMLVIILIEAARSH
jgi:hypothetical protein